MTVFRSNQYGTTYGPIFPKPFYDLDIIKLTTTFCLFALCFLMVIPSFRKTWRSAVVYLGFFVTAGIGYMILLANFGYGWQSSEGLVHTPYSGHNNNFINATVGLKVGLQGINVTLIGSPEKQLNEDIYYNERFEWVWRQGRGGYGKYAGRINREFRAHQERGVPYPILFVAEYFTLDGDEIRWGRYYRLAGHYTFIMVWTAFASWLVTCICLFIKLRPAAVWFMITGANLLIGNIVYAALVKHPQNGPLVIPVGSWEGEPVDLHPDFGWTYYMTMANGIICFAVAAAIFVAVSLYPELDYVFSARYKSYLEEPKKLETDRSLSKRFSAWRQRTTRYVNRTLTGVPGPQQRFNKFERFSSEKDGIGKTEPKTKDTLVPPIQEVEIMEHETEMGMKV
eukprot:Colp12_sorted_trinity150504_noHs@3741